MAADSLDIKSLLELRFRTAAVAAYGDDFRNADCLIAPGKFSDFQSNMAMPLAKLIAGNPKPREIAERITGHFETAGLCKLDIAGAGFINVDLDPAFLHQRATALQHDPRLGVPEVAEKVTTVVDYSSPNVAKEMHVGHLRSTVIGDCLTRILGFIGHKVIRQNHLGDWGTQFGMLIAALSELPAEDRGTRDLTRLYQDAKIRFDSDPTFQDTARARVVALQGGDPTALAIWTELVASSARYFEDVYKRLDILLTTEDIRGESFYNPWLPDVVRALEASGHLKESEGARVVYPPGYLDRENKPLPMVVQKSDGGFLYSTTDLAAARYRLNEIGAKRVIYVVDARQSQHFAMLFTTLRHVGWATPEHQLEHVAFGTVLGIDKKPFKTRQGDLIRLSDLVTEAEERALNEIRKKNPDLPAEEQPVVAHAVGVGCLKYADLSSDRIKDYVFDWNRMISFEGNTAAYIQYSYTRARSIMRKGEVDDDTITAFAIHPEEAQERAILLKLLMFPTVIQRVAQSLEPHHLCGLVYEIASASHKFYEQCPVLQAPTEEKKQSRLAICQLIARALKLGLNLLGISTVERM